MIVGGASGVGKTTLLERNAVQRFNTGDLFKKHMALSDRDGVRSGDWSLVEDTVATDLKELILQSLCARGEAIVDTHFAAKILGRTYRIGMREDLLFDIGTGALQLAEANGVTLSLKVALVTCDPYELMKRRRLDKGRNREVVPADCFNALRQNLNQSTHYLSEIRRAGLRNAVNSAHTFKRVIIENADIQAAAEQIKAILGE